MDWEELEKLDDVPLTDWIRQRMKSEGILKLFGNYRVLDFNIFCVLRLPFRHFLTPLILLRNRPKALSYLNFALLLSATECYWK